MTVAAPVNSPARAYAEDVAAGRVVAGPLVRRACQRHLRDLQRAGRSDFPYVFDEELEQRFYRFAAYINLSEGLRLVLDPFQQFITGSLFGWVHQETGDRRFRTAYIEIGKGNGKTPLAAVVCLYGLVADGETKPEIYSAATTRDQAKILFTDAKVMCEATPQLAQRLEVLEHNLSFGRGFMRPLSSEGKSLDGKRPHITAIDEIHEHPTDVVVRKMRAGMKNRRQPLVFEITNSGFDRHSICWEHHEHSRQVVEGTVEDETWFAYVCGLDEGDDWHDEAVWPKANPGLGTILPLMYLREQMKEADAMPSAQQLVKRLNFCIWTEGETKWLDLGDWDACADPDVTEATLRGERCFAGLDLSSTVDITAFVLWFPERRAVLPYFWVPREAGSRRWERNRVPYPLWIDQGHLEATPGNVTDYDRIRERIREMAGIFRIEQIAVDRWNSTQLVTQLQQDGAPVFWMGQGFASMNGPSKELEALVAGRRLRHGGHPVLRWMVGNAVAAQDPAGNIKPDKERSADKIDGIPALIGAIAAAAGDTGERRSVYDERELRAL